MISNDKGQDGALNVAETDNVENVPKGFVPTPFPFHFEVNLEIDTLDDRLGWGRGHLADETKQEESAAVILEKVPPGWEIRVPLVLPNELVRVRIFKNFDTYSEADFLEVIKSSPERIKPRCPLAGKCAGCQFQHMKIEHQRRWKTDFVRSGLESQKIRGYTNTVDANFTATAVTTDIDRVVDSNTKINSTSIREILFPTMGTDEIFEYRNKLTPHYEAPVQLGDDEYELEAIGFQQVSCREIIDVEDCPIATPAINVKFREIRASLHEKAKTGVLNNKKKRRRNRRKDNCVGATLLFREADNDSKTGKPVVVTEYKEYMTTTIKNIKFRYMAGNFFVLFGCFTRSNDPFLVCGMIFF